MDDLRHKARNLRKQGRTFTEIQHSVGEKIPKSTLSYWCKGISLTKLQTQRIRQLAKANLKLAREAAVQSQERRRLVREEERVRLAKEFVGSVSHREAKIALAMLYLGEGGKYPSGRGLVLGNSDLRVVRLYTKLLEICYGIGVSELKCTVYHRADQNLDQLTEYWSSSTGIPASNFYKSQADPRTQGKPTKNSDYKGVASIYCKGVDKQLELDQIANALLEGMS